MVFFSSLDPVNSYLFWGAAGTFVAGAVFVGRKAKAAPQASWVKRWGLWTTSTLLALVGLGSLVCARTVGADDVGIGRTKTFEVGTYLWPSERFVSINRAGSFLIPYPNERIFLLIEYKVSDPAKLKGLYEQLLSHRAALGKEHFLSACGLDESWKHGSDPLASWLQAKTRDRMPNNPTAGDNYIQYSLEPVTSVLIECGVSARVSLVRKELLRSF